MNNLQNPFFVNSSTLHGAFRFDILKNNHFIPALKKGIEEHKQEIKKIIENKEKPNFNNTIVALERSGYLFTHVLTVFFALDAADTNDEMQKIAQKISPIITAHNNNITLNESLFKRIKYVYENRENLDLDSEDAMLLQKTYEKFERNGANLSPTKKEQFKDISTKLDLTCLKFEQNYLNAINKFDYLVTNESELKGMPCEFMDMTKKDAERKGLNGWLLNLRTTCYTPLMKYCENRSLREKIWISFNQLCINGEFSNIQNIIDIVNLRLELAKLFDCKNFAEYVLKYRMAENTNNVYNLINKLIEAYKPKAKEELSELQEFANSIGADFDIMPWDHSYYSEKLKNKKFNINDNILKPYFKLENVKTGIFDLATKLYGIKFKLNKEIPVYNDEVDAYEVTNENGKYIAILYTDFHPREGKRAGAWMTEYKSQWKNEDGADSRPHITIVMNFTRPTDSTPALLSFSEVKTFLHEFGHALHGMLTECKYSTLSGTNVLRDFVELPSQIMENWASEKTFLDKWAKHYETNKIIPDSLIKRIIDASNFNCGYFCLRQISFGLQDMAFHTITETFDKDPIDFEHKSTSNAKILPEINDTGRCVTFGHIFSGGYAAGYYSYKWAEILDADAFSLFKEKGIFDKATAKSFQKNILSKGATEHPMILYKKFRGKEPSIKALLKRNNI